MNLEGRCKYIYNLKILNKNSGTQYPIIKEVADELEFQVGVDHYTFLWTDQLLSIK